jgi:hypothetical protein
VAEKIEERLNKKYYYSLIEKRDREIQAKDFKDRNSTKQKNQLILFDSKRFNQRNRPRVATIS